MERKRGSPRHDKCFTKILLNMRKRGNEKEKERKGKLKKIEIATIF